MDFLFKDRGSGKRTIKPSKDSESLEACMAAEESDDSDFEVFEKQSGKYFMSTLECKYFLSIRACPFSYWKVYFFSHFVSLQIINDIKREVHIT